VEVKVIAVTFAVTFADRIAVPNNFKSDKLIFEKSWPRGYGCGGHHMYWQAMV